MTQPHLTDAGREALAKLIAETTSRGEALRAGDYLGSWEKGNHPYGQPRPCPFCKSPQKYTNLWYNGPGSPPSYAWQCDDCGAQGPTSSGKFRGDHYGAIMDALDKWNAAALHPAQDGVRIEAAIRAEARREALEEAARVATDYSAEMLGKSRLARERVPTLVLEAHHYAGNNLAKNFIALAVGDEQGEKA